MELKLIWNADSETEAFILKGNLSQNGIPAYIVHGTGIQVNKEQAEEAKEILQEIRDNPFTDENDEVIACPHCGSTKYYRRIATSRGLKAYLRAMFVYFTSIPIDGKHVHICKECDSEFEVTN